MSKYNENIISKDKLNSECKEMSLKIFLGFKGFLDSYFEKLGNGENVVFSKEDYTKLKEITEIINR